MLYLDHMSKAKHITLRTKHKASDLYSKSKAKIKYQDKQAQVQVQALDWLNVKFSMVTYFDPINRTLSAVKNSSF